MPPMQADHSESGHEQDGKEIRSTPAETKKTSSAHDSAQRASQPERESDSDRMLEWKKGELKDMGFHEADRK